MLIIFGLFDELLLAEGPTTLLQARALDDRTRFEKCAGTSMAAKMIISPLCKGPIGAVGAALFAKPLWISVFVVFGLYADFAACRTNRPPASSSCFG